MQRKFGLPWYRELGCFFEVFGNLGGKSFFKSDVLFLAGFDFVKVFVKSEFLL